MRKTLGLMATITGLSLLAAAPANANNAGGKPAVATTTSAKAEKKVCKPVEHTGTHRVERVCMTAKQWRQVEAQAANSF